MGALTLAATLSMGATGRAEDALVGIGCPELDRERAAELESRARAALLLSQWGSRVRISCGNDDALVEATLGSTSETLRVSTTPATLVDDVLAGVDQALQRLAPSPAEPAESKSAEAPREQPTLLEPARQPSPPPAPATALEARKHPQATPQHLALAAAAALEAWANRPAGGVVVGALRGRGPLWFGLSCAVFRPLRQAPQFDVSELSLAASVTLSPTFARGISVTLEAGPSWLWTSPEAGLIVRSHTLSAAFAGSAALTWPIWRGRTGILPALGVRWFAPERGIRLDEVERFAVRGVAPRVSLGLAYRID